MEQRSSIPDFVSDFSGKGFETKPGIQYVGAIAPTRVQPGERSYLTFVVQNALDARVEGDINVALPGRVVFKKTNLSTISPVHFVLEGGEAEKIVIPIDTASATPEGEYEVEILIEGTGGKGGNRIRDTKGDGKNWGKAAAKSIAATAAISAVGLLFGGVGVRVYTPSNRMKTSFAVKGNSANVGSGALEVHREKLWLASYDETYQVLAKWVGENLQAWSSKDEVRNAVFDRFTSKVSSVFQAVGYNMSSEEFLWLGRFAGYMHFEGGFVSSQKLSMIALQHAKDLAEGGVFPEENVLLEKTSFEKDVIQRWFDSFSDDGFVRSLSAMIGILFVSAVDKASNRSLVQQAMQVVHDNLTGVKEDKKTVSAMLLYFLASAISDPGLLFPKAEIAEHLGLLREGVVSSKFFGASEKGLIGLIDKKIAQGKLIGQ